jgi:hypothetical protein
MTMAVNRDSIVEEVRKHREARAAKFGFNIRAMVEDARKRQAKSGHLIVDLAQQGKAEKPRKTAGKSLLKKGLTSSKR